MPVCSKSSASQKSTTPQSKLNHKNTEKTISGTDEYQVIKGVIDGERKGRDCDLRRGEPGGE